MFLSRMTFDEHIPSGQERELDLYDVHQRLWQVFGDHPDRDRDFIYRVDSQDPLCVYTLSERKPADSTEQWRVESKPFAPRLQTGDVLDFRLRFNAVVTRRNADGKHARYDIVRAALKQNGDAPPPPTHDLVQEKGAEWVAQRGEENGAALFELRHCIIRAYRREQVRRRKNNGKLTDLAVMDAEGTLAVGEPQAFRYRLLKGFGRGRAFGMGLMLVRRSK